jgi:hypothetical protein
MDVLNSVYGTTNLDIDVSSVLSEQLRIIGYNTTIVDVDSCQI